MKVRMMIEVELEEAMIPTDDEERVWTEREILIGNGTLLLHSNEIGDLVGVVTAVSNLSWVDEKEAAR